MRQHHGRRYQDAIGRKAAARYYKIVHDAELQYIPELHNSEMLVLDCFVGTPEREGPSSGPRGRCFTWPCTSRATTCYQTKSHTEFPADHPAVHCEAQQRHLAEVLHSLAECMGEVLTPFGATDINSTESLHAVLGRYRPKGDKWGAVQCFLGETMGLLHWQRLQLAFWQPAENRNPKIELAQLIAVELSIRVPFDRGAGEGR